ncbi:alpha/beta hydrolase [bacterium SCSIO 12741]|nr:alpha/beta hydrolase [bacterium SCSIO 12741]
MATSVSYRNSRISYSVSGSGLNVVLLHGFLESSSMWKGMVPELSKKFKVITIDLPGHGESDCLGYIHTMDLMAGAVKAVLDEIGLRKAVIIGHSMGGYVALALADLYPDIIKGVCLFHSSAKGDSDEKKANRDRAIELVKTNPKTFIRAAIPLLFRHKFRSPLKAEITAAKNEALQFPVQGIIAALEGMKRRPNREIMLRFPPYPILFVASRWDPVFNLQDLQEQMNISEDVEGVVVKESGHMGHLESPEESLQILTKFCTRCR